MKYAYENVRPRRDITEFEDGRRSVDLANGRNVGSRQSRRHEHVCGGLLLEASTEKS